jgi:hypothetical protein
MSLIKKILLVASSWIETSKDYFDSDFESLTR